MEYGTFAELLRKVYVEAGSDHLSSQGRKATVSGISALTGLTRKETKRLKELDEPISEDTHHRYNRSIRVIGGWLNDARFCDDNGLPAPLSLDGGDCSFAELAKDYSGDIPPSAMLKILELSRCVEVNENRVELLQHAYIPENDPLEKIDILGTDAAELINTINHNLSAPTDALLFQRKVSNTRVKVEAKPLFRKMAYEKSQKLLEELDQFLSENEIEGNQTPNQDNYVALGIYDASATVHSLNEEKNL